MSANDRVDAATERLARAVLWRRTAIDVDRAETNQETRP